jgi:hypothetical protein
VDFLIVRKQSMRTYFLIMLMVSSSGIFAQNKLNRLSINPIQLIGYNRLNLEFERGFKEGKFGIGYYIGQTGNSSRKVHGQYSTLSEQNISIKFYLKKIDKSCFWYGSVLSVSSGNIYSDNGVDKATNIGALGILASTGYQFIFKSFLCHTILKRWLFDYKQFFGSA